VESIPVSQVLSFLRDDTKQKSIELVHAFLLLSCSPRIRTPLITAASAHFRSSAPILSICDAAYTAACAPANGALHGGIRDGGGGMFYKWIAQWFSSYTAEEIEEGGPSGNNTTTTTIMVDKPRRHWFALSFIAFTAGIAGGWMLHEQLSLARIALKGVRWIYTQWQTRQ
jgi:hypothetical protein